MGADDYVILVSLAFSWVFFGLMVGEVYHGMGEHYRDIPAATFKTQMLVSSAAEHPSNKVRFH